MKKRYVYLDGLRGLAAMIVMIFHARTLWNFNFERGYLAVDIFFLLSGFVIASAYDQKISKENLNTLMFMKARIIRLYPVYLLSAFISLPLFLNEYLGRQVVTFDKLFFAITAFSLNALMIPSYSSYSPVIFPINLIYWTLFYELLANLAFVVFHRFLTGRKLLALVLLMGTALIIITFKQGIMDGGNTWRDAPIGFFRAFFGIFAGVMLFRCNHQIARLLPALPGWLYLIVGCSILAIPRSELYDPFVDIIAVMCVFPICLLALANAQTSRFEGVLVALGSASYPLYLFHLQTWKYIEAILHHHAERYAPYIGIVTLGGLLLFAIVLERKVDEPFRRWLTQHLFTLGKRRLPPEKGKVPDGF